MKALFNTLGLALVLLAMGRPLLAQGRAQPDTAFVPAPPRTGLENTIWSGNEDMGDNRPVKFVFHNSGRVTRVDELGANSASTGSYRVVGSRVIMTFDEIDMVYTGTLDGSTLRGTARFDGDSWGFEVRRRQQAPPRPPQPFSGSRAAPGRQTPDTERQPLVPPLDLDRDSIVPPPLDLEDERSLPLPPAALPPPVAPTPFGRRVPS